MHTEEQLLTELAAGKRSATELIYRQHYNTITKWIKGNNGSEDDASDIYQEAMVVLYEKAQNEDFRLTCKIGTYLFAISKNLWYKKIEQYQKMPVRLPDSAGQDDRMDWAADGDISAHREREAYYTQLNAALDKLGEPCSSLLKAFYHKDKSMQDIAADFGYTNSENAKTQKYKCLTRLRKLFFGAQAK
ncbi:MAG: sigma-70 family RNA polymerase sigma factor [Sphingobacteriales bacterium]|nr:MAG: sigma-70 family RNA polymerase sigma factor [Sphingobacteriales bacterium]